MPNIKMATILMASLASFLAAQVDPPSRVGRLSYREGPVSFQPTGINDWVDADINRPLTTGDNIWVGDRGRAEFHVGSTALRLSAGSDFEFLNLDDQAVQIRLAQGTLSVRLRNLAQDQIFEIDTPNLAFTLNRPGDYRIEANPDSQVTVVTVRDGEGEVTGGGQDFPVYSRQRVVVIGFDQINYNLESAYGPDEFDQWCAGRNRREDQSLSARYVSREIPGYDDLDQYGRWSDQPGYGQVWMPTLVDADWAPYRDGHWAWIAPWGWTWVDEAPWGFAPYHYGRWSSFGGRWGWIPGPYGVTPLYAPALVGWVGGGGGRSGFSLSFSIGTALAVGWFPLGPREPYFPSYRVSQGYFARVNTSNTVINNTTINNYYNYSRDSNNREITNIQYANRNVSNGVTAVPQSSFASGRQITREARAVPAAQLASVPVMSAPAIAPQRESVLGSRADTASRAPRPPANVQSRPVVARTAPPPAAVPFERQRAALAQNPGRPLAATEVQQMRQSAPVPVAPVRVVDMSRVRRTQPPVGRGPDGVLPQNAPPQPRANERNDAPGQIRQQQQQQQQDVRRQQQNIPQQEAPVNERRNGPPGQVRQQQQQEVLQEQQQRELQRQQQQQQDVRRQQQNVPQPQAPVNERQNVPPGQVRQQQEVLQEQQQRELQRQQQQQQQDVRRQQQQDLQRQQQQELQRQQQQQQQQQELQQQQDLQRQQQRQQQQQQEMRRRQQGDQPPQQNVPQPPVNERQNVPPGQVRQQQQQPQPDIQRQQQDLQRQQQQQRQLELQQQQQQRQQELQQQQQQQRQQELQQQQQQQRQQELQQQRDLQRQQQRQQQQQQEMRRQQQSAPPPQPPAAERQNAPPPQPPVARPPAQQPGEPAGDRQRPDRGGGRQQRPPKDDDKKSDK